MGHQYEAISSCYFTSLQFIITYIVAWSYLYCFYGNLGGDCPDGCFCVELFSCRMDSNKHTFTVRPTPPLPVPEQALYCSSPLVFMGRRAGRLWRPGVAMPMTSSAHLPQFCSVIWTQSRLWHLSCVRDQGRRLWVRSGNDQCSMQAGGF